MIVSLPILLVRILRGGTYSFHISVTRAVVYNITYILLHLGWTTIDTQRKTHTLTPSASTSKHSFPLGMDKAGTARACFFLPPAVTLEIITIGPGG